VQRLWVRWALLVVFVVALAVLFVNLGEWQLRRLAERETRNATTISNERAPVQPYERVFTRVIVDADQWQRVTATGTFDGEHQFVVRNRNNGENRGFEVVTPLRTATGTVLVDRGFIPVVPGTGIPAVGPPPPTGEVTVVGHVRRNEQGRSGAISPANGSVRLINSDALQPAIGYPVANGFISAIEMTPPQQGGFVPVAVPELTSGPHFWYAMQWFMFAGIGVLGIVVFIRSDLRDRRTARERAAAGEAATERQRTPGDT
jgi:cytochrome oxidase assembly protein ShyY1